MNSITPVAPSLPIHSKARCAGVPLALLLLLLCAVFVSATAFAAPTQYAPDAYRDATEEARFHALASTLRCVMCQNESLADSDAPIAHDLRRKILELMRRGQSDAQIRDFLVARYGEFVLYRPRVEPATWPLWFGPFILFVIGGITVAVVVDRRAKSTPAPTDPGKIADPSVESSEDW
jgi:cytochrome c-type biogenesis protein CcmH